MLVLNELNRELKALYGDRAMPLISLFLDIAVVTCFFGFMF